MANSKCAKPPLLCWDIYSDFFNRSLERMDDIKFLEDFLQDKHCELPCTAAECIKNYDAVIITDLQRNIHWASSGLYDMSGYTQQEVVHRNPAFLQGPQTDNSVKSSIREKLQQYSSTDATLINYRKSGARYQCKIEITPIQNKKMIPEFFIALEKALP